MMYLTKIERCPRLHLINVQVKYSLNFYQQNKTQVPSSAWTLVEWPNCVHNMTYAD